MQDFLFFITTSVRGTEKETTFDKLLELYHAELELCLKELNWLNPIPTLDKLKSEVKSRGILGKLQILWV